MKFNKGKHILKLSIEESELYQEGFCCDICKSPIMYKNGEEFFYCKLMEMYSKDNMRGKIICHKCELKIGDLPINEVNTCTAQRYKSHPHFNIKQVITVPFEDTSKKIKIKKIERGDN